LEGWKLQFYYVTSNFCLNIPIYIGKIPKKIGILLNKLKASKKIGMFNNKMEVPNLPKYYATAIDVSGNVMDATYSKYNTYWNPTDAKAFIGSGLQIKILSLDSTNSIPVIKKFKKIFRNRP